MRRYFAFLTLLLLLVARTQGQDLVAADSFTITTTPTFKGLRATADLPVSQQTRNVGGSDGAGLCVYTSVLHSCRWQSVSELYGFRAWMETQPGGSYPEKFDATMQQYCKLKGIAVPPYIQHTGGDEEFLVLALKTGRMVAVTYCGVDGPGRYGGQVIGHMVNLVYLDQQYAAILDNNFVGTWLWMTRAEFLARWRGIQENGRAYRVRGGMPIGGGWAIVFLRSPPAPYPSPPVQSANAPCPCGDDCTCTPGECPSRCPLKSPISIEQCPSCPNGRCPLPRFNPAPAPTPIAPERSQTPAEELPPATSPPRPGPNGWPGEGYLWKKIPGVGDGWIRPEPAHDWGRTAEGFGWVPKTEPAVEAPLPRLAIPENGVDGSKIAGEKKYSLSGEPCTREEAHGALSLSDDSGKWFLSAVGDPAFLAQVKADVAKLSPDLRAKLHVQGYAPDAWQVSQFHLAPGLILRQPAVNRVGATVGTVAIADYSSERLTTLLTVSGGPNPAPVAPPAPLPAPPTPPPVPAPAPLPAPAPPEPVQTQNHNLAAAALVAILTALGRYLLRKG